MMGEGCFERGEAKITLGSGAFFGMYTGSAKVGKRGGSGNHLLDSFPKFCFGFG